MGLRSNTRGVDSELAFETTPAQQSVLNNEAIEIGASPNTKKTSLSKAQKTQAGLQVAQSAGNIFNSIVEFEQIESRAFLNTMLANNQFEEALRLGQEQALGAETEGFARGEQALLSAVAQGQDVEGGIAQSAQLAEETIGILNAMNIETNAINQAYGFKREAALIEHETNLAEINRNAQIATSALSGAIGVSQFI